MVFYRVARDKGLDMGGVWLGFCVRGIRVFSLYRGIKTALHHCPWKHITNLSFAVSAPCNTGGLLVLVCVL